MKKLVGEMSDLLNKIVKFSDDYADVKDIFLNDSTMELAEDAIGSLKFLNNSRKALSIIKFKYFLKGLNYENADKESIEKLIRYVDNQSKAEFITNSFDKIISSNSKLACCVMGLMLNDIGQHNDDISQEDLIMLNALPMLNDFDIKNFHYLYKISSKNHKSNHNISPKDIKECVQLYNITRRNLYLTMGVLEKYNLMDKNIDVDLDIDEDNLDFSSVDCDETYYFNSIRQKLYTYSSMLFKD